MSTPPLLAKSLYLVLDLVLFLPMKIRQQRNQPFFSLPAIVHDLDLLGQEELPSLSVGIICLRIEFPFQVLPQFQTSRVG